MLCYIVGVVAVEDEQCHNPEDHRSLEKVVIVVVVRILFGVSPSMPCWDECEYKDYELCPGRMMSEFVRKVGDLSLVSACLSCLALKLGWLIIPVRHLYHSQQCLKPFL